MVTIGARGSAYKSKQKKEAAGSQAKHTSKKLSSKAVARRSRGITDGSIRRLARRGGCTRLAGNVYEYARKLLRDYVTAVLKDVNAIVSIKSDKTVLLRHVLYALRRQGRTMYVKE